MNFVEEKASVLKWLISAQGLIGIPSISEGYYLTPLEIGSIFGATLDENGLLIPVTVTDIYYKNGKRISGSEIQQEVQVSLSTRDILSNDGVEIIPAPGEGMYIDYSDLIFDVGVNKLTFKFSLHGTD